MQDGSNIVVISGLVIGLVYGAVGLWSDFLPAQRAAWLVGRGRQPLGPVA